MDLQKYSKRRGARERSVPPPKGKCARVPSLPLTHAASISRIPATSTLCGNQEHIKSISGPRRARHLDVQCPHGTHPCTVRPRPTPASQSLKCKATPDIMIRFTMILFFTTVQWLKLICEHSCCLVTPYKKLNVSSPIVLCLI